MHNIAYDIFESKTTEYIILFLILIDLCVVIFEVLVLDKAEKEHNEDFHELEEILHTLVLGIHIIFTIELFGKIALHGKEFFSHYGHLIDLVIIPTSLILELLASTTFNETGSFLTLFRLWRFIRIIHGTYEIERDHWLHKIEDMEKEIHLLQTKLKEAGIDY